MDLKWNGWSFADLYKVYGPRIETLRQDPLALREVWHQRRYLVVTVTAVAVAALCLLELHSSWLESSVLPEIAKDEHYTLQHGASHAAVQSLNGPYDQRLGMARLGGMIQRLHEAGFEVQDQAAGSPITRELSSFGIQPVYREKSQAGLSILDREGQPIFHALYPHRVYPNFSSIPPVIVQTLLFIENRQMLDAAHPRRNPAVQWGRLARAFGDLAVHSVDRSHPMIGGSTLATQLVKLRHSQAGRTGSVLEKARQVAAASLRAYDGGPDTVPEQQQIICDYINTIPLAATRSEGEVIGLADGLKDWYDADPDAINNALFAREDTMSRAQLQQRAWAYRDALSLLLALHAPTRELAENPAGLRARVDLYLPVLAANGIISTRLRDLALRIHPPLRPGLLTKTLPSFIANKAPDAIRVSLLSRLGVDQLYALDRMDLTVNTTLDKPAQNAVSSFLSSLSEQQNVQAAGLSGYQLLGTAKPGRVIYSVTLYERGKGENVLRVQTDNYDQPLDINRGTRLQLGSTAKLRTMINYLQIIEALHQRYAGKPPSELKQETVLPGDNLTRWAIDYLAAAADRSLEPMLRAALNRKYSGSPGEAFFTAGGLHHFDNFDSAEDRRFFTVGDAFQNSVNLAFIRLMRDIERYYVFRAPGASPSVLSDPDAPSRQRYLDRFADFEGRTFMGRFYRKYSGQTPNQALQTVLAGIQVTPVRAAVIFRSVRPQANLAEFTDFLQGHLPQTVLAHEDMGELYEKYGPDKFNLNDRGYLAHVHPLELWLLNYRERHPGASLGEVFRDSAAQRLEVYHWLFRTEHAHAQDKRIETLLEIDAFKEIHRAWKQLGYPFDSLTPSYATCIGVSGDTPEALAELVGILMNGGVRYPTVRVSQLHFFAGTPFETILAPRAQPGVRVLSPVIARLVREQMVGVVQNGTGRRASGGMKLPDGVSLAIGGKTGTGDNRLQEFNARGGVLASRQVNRTAAFVFFIGDRFYGTILAFVPGQAASGYNFTSALAVQILKDLEPRIEPLVAGSAKSKL